MANKLKNKPSQTAKNVAVIMDGNGRWAVANSLNISKGHSKGVEIVREIVEESINQEISSLTLYAFSSENWSRPKSEVEAIKKLIVSAINEQVPDLVKQKVRLKFFGCIDDFGSKIISKIHKAEKQTGSYKQVLDLNVAIGYGGRQDIVNITKEISEDEEKKAEKKTREKEVETRRGKKKGMQARAHLDPLLTFFARPPLRRVCAGNII